MKKRIYNIIIGVAMYSIKIVWDVADLLLSLLALFWTTIAYLPLMARNLLDSMLSRITSSKPRLYNEFDDNEELCDAILNTWESMFNL